MICLKTGIEIETYVNHEDILGFKNGKALYKIDYPNGLLLQIS